MDNAIKIAALSFLGVIVAFLAPSIKDAVAPHLSPFGIVVLSVCLALVAATFAYWILSDPGHPNRKKLSVAGIVATTLFAATTAWDAAEVFRYNKERDLLSTPLRLSIELTSLPGGSLRSMLKIENKLDKQVSISRFHLDARNTTVYRDFRSDNIYIQPLDSSSLPILKSSTSAESGTVTGEMEVFVDGDRKPKLLRFSLPLEVTPGNYQAISSHIVQEPFPDVERVTLSAIRRDRGYLLIDINESDLRQWGGEVKDDLGRSKTFFFFGEQDRAVFGLQVGEYGVDHIAQGMPSGMHTVTLIWNMQAETAQLRMDNGDFETMDLKQFRERSEKERKAVS